MNNLLSGLKIHVRGIVQGVGFRPFVYGLAVNYQVSGWVRNTSSGVDIEINGSPDNLAAFLHELKTNPPPLARIDQLESCPCEPNGYVDFQILESLPEPDQFIPISPDIAICPDCSREMLDPSNRRYRYPFINCTNCGPRFTIIQDIPYDRPKTTMSGFPMCPECRAEYENPLDRRFHAQPTACPVCGPQLYFEAGGHTLAHKEEALQMARDYLRKGKILAIKGLGGYHLACDASNPEAVTELRRRKKRSDKPFALMAYSIEAIEKQALVTPVERQLLTSRHQPIVLLQRKENATVAPENAPQQKRLGFMLPYTPLHLLLMEPDSDFPDVLVMTSGNLSEEPIAYQDQDAQDRLTGLADGFLLHNRPIHTRTDDSVLTTVGDKPYFTRRSRGYAPDPIALHQDTAPILAVGAELKNTFCLTRDRYAFMSHHIGDLENLETLLSFETGIDHFERLFRITPEQIACDLHPDYLSTRYALQRGQAESLPVTQVQHHHAHLAACLADNGWKPAEPVIGLIFDGTGYGTDGAIWGGEVLFGDFSNFTRAYHLSYTPLPGGDAAVRKPARTALAHLWAAGLDWDTDLPPVQYLCAQERQAIRSQLEHHLNAPNTSSMGRLFDAASSLIGIRHSVNYEGQAAIEMEAAADADETGFYEFSLDGDRIDTTPFWTALIADLRQGTSVQKLAARVHHSVARLNLQLCSALRQATGCSTVALSGGVWQNRLLLENTVRLLEKDHYSVLIHRQVPTNDGGIALGQALIVSFQNKEV
jgi:hydrogenase maturation protein HypF